MGDGSTERTPEPATELTWRQVLRTTAAHRRFTDRPVERGVLSDVLDTARHAASGGNRQPWRVAVVDDRAIRRRLGDLMRPVLAEYAAVARAGGTAFAVGSPPPPAGAGDQPVASPLVDGIEQAPVVLAIAADLRRISFMDGDLDRISIVGGASIYPFCWSILLAARAHGLGGVLTTFLSRAEPGAAELLHLPEHHALAATIFLGYPDRHVTKLKRRPVDRFTTLDTFDGPPFTGDPATVTR